MSQYNNIATISYCYNPYHMLIAVKVTDDNNILKSNTLQNTVTPTTNYAYQHSIALLYGNIFAAVILSGSSPYPTACTFKLDFTSLVLTQISSFTIPGGSVYTGGTNGNIECLGIADGQFGIVYICSSSLYFIIVNVSPIGTISTIYTAMNLSTVNYNSMCEFKPFLMQNNILAIVFRKTDTTLNIITYKIDSTFNGTVSNTNEILLTINGIGSIKSAYPQVAAYIDDRHIAVCGDNGLVAVYRYSNNYQILYLLGYVQCLKISTSINVYGKLWLSADGTTLFLMMAGSGNWESAKIVSIPFVRGNVLGVSQPNNKTVLSGIASGFNGLIAGRKYYFDSAGTISNKYDGNSYIGTAISDTEILVQGLI